MAGLTAPLAPATAAAARNLRRSSFGLFFGLESFFGISISRRHHSESASGTKTAAPATWLQSTMANPGVPAHPLRSRPAGRAWVAVRGPEPRQHSAAAQWVQAPRRVLAKLSE